METMRLVVRFTIETLRPLLRTQALLVRRMGHAMGGSTDGNGRDDRAGREVTWQSCRLPASSSSDTWFAIASL